LVNKLVLENLKFRPVRTALSVVAIGLEVTMMLTIVGLSQGMSAESQRRARGVGADVFIRPPGSSALSLSSAPLPQKMVEWAEKQPHVAIAVGAMNHPVSGLTLVTGIDLDRFKAMSGGFRMIKGHLPRKPDDILVDRYYARQNKLTAGSSLKLLNRDPRIPMRSSRT
jgi:putative ABC transport system permease protein